MRFKIKRSDSQKEKHRTWFPEQTPCATIFNNMTSLLALWTDCAINFVALVNKYLACCTIHQSPPDTSMEKCESLIEDSLERNDVSRSSSKSHNCILTFYIEISNCRHAGPLMQTNRFISFLKTLQQSNQCCLSQKCFAYANMDGVSADLSDAWVFCGLPAKTIGSLNIDQENPSDLPRIVLVDKWRQNRPG